MLIGGLVPHLLCAASAIRHAGTTDIDVQVNLEIAGGAINTARLERALRDANFEPDAERVWRWATVTAGIGTVIKFELLADLDDQPAGATVTFDDCDQLGAANLRGTGIAAHDAQPHTLRATDGGVPRRGEILGTGLAGYLLAKVAAAHARRKTKDWYDIAYVLVHIDAGGPHAAATQVIDRFGSELGGPLRTAMHDLAANFTTPSAQGPSAYASQMIVDHPDVDRNGRGRRRACSRRLLRRTRATSGVERGRVSEPRAGSSCHEPRCRERAARSARSVALM